MKKHVDGTVCTNILKAQKKRCRNLISYKLKKIKLLLDFFSLYGKISSE